MPDSKTTQRAITYELDIESAAVELWLQTKNDSSDWDWDRVIDVRKQAYRRIAVAILSAAGCMSGLRKSE